MNKVAMFLLFSAIVGAGWGRSMRSDRTQIFKAVADAPSGYHVPRIVDFACGETHSLAIDSNGHLWQWGRNISTKPQHVLPGQRFRKVSAGKNMSAALDDQGNAYIWSGVENPELVASNVETVLFAGPEKYYTRSNGQSVPISYDVVPGKENSTFRPDLFLSNYGTLEHQFSSQVTTAPTYAYNRSAVLAGGGDYWWNSNEIRYYGFYTLLGKNTKDEEGFFIDFLSTQRYSAASVSGSRTWYYGPTVLASPSDSQKPLIPAYNLVTVRTPSDGFYSDFALTKQHSNASGFALSEEGNLYSFGYNLSTTNILGSEATLLTDGQVDEPVLVSVPNKIVSIDAGTNFAMALDTFGNLFSWGSNAYGQLGVGDNSNRTLPTLVSFLSSNTQYSFVASKGDAYEGSFALDGMNSYSVSLDPTKGSLTLDADTGDFIYTPDNAATGKDYFEIEISNGVNTKTYIVNVIVDYKPVWQSFETAFVIRPGQSFNGAAPAYDEDGDALRFRIVQYPSQGEVAIDGITGAFVYSANDDGAGDDSFIIAVSDGHVSIQKTINVHIETYISVDDVYERAFDTTSVPVHYESQLSAIDEDGDSLIWSTVSQPSLGSLILNPDTGSYSYDAESGTTGDDHFILQVTDGVYPVQKEYTVHLYSIEDAGTSLVNVTKTGRSFSDQILTNAQNTVVSYDVKSQGEYGVVTIDSESGKYTYTPLENTRGQDSFIINVAHTYGRYELEVFVYQNSVPNDSLVETKIVVEEDGSYSGSVACSDLDLGDALSYSLKNIPMKGNVDLNASTGSYVYTALPGLAGNDVFTVIVSDGFNKITIVISVHIESQVQTETNIYCTTTQSVQIKGRIKASDKDGDALSYSLKSGASHGVAQVNGSGAYVYTPDVGFYGDDSFLATVTDGVNPVDVTIHVHVNRKPIAVSDAVSLVATGSSITSSVSVEDADGDALIYSIDTQPSKGVATVDSGNGKFSYTPNQGAAGDDLFVIKASDGIDYALIPVNVHNETEVRIDTSATNLTASQGKILNGVVVAIDDDGDELTYCVVAEPTKGALSLNSHTGSWSYACNADAQGDDSFEISVTDGAKEKNVTFHLTINIPPKVSEESELFFATNQGSPYVGTVLGTDAEGDGLSYSVVAQGKKGSVTIDPSNGQYTYMPHEGVAGDDQFVLGISDGSFVTLVIVSAHIESDIVVDESVQHVGVDKGGLVVGNVLASDADGDALSYSISTKPTKGAASVDSNGAWSFLADGDDAGSDSFVIAVTDGVHTKYVTVYVHIDTAPLFDTDSQTINVPGNGSVTGDVAATDLDGDQLTYSMEEMPKYGTVNLNSATGSYTYSNTAKADGDKFRIKVSDTNGNEAVIVVYVWINNAPTVQNLALSVRQGESVEGQLVAVDSEQDPLAYSIFSQGSKGLASVDEGTGKVVYVANRGTSGVDTFEVSIFDGTSVVKTTVVVTIQANSAPVSHSLNVTMQQGGSASGTINASDVDGDELTFTISTDPSNGVVRIDPTTGNFVYVPNHDFSGADSFAVRVSDGLAYRDVTVYVSVNKNESPKPKAEQQNYSVAQGGALSGTIEVDDMEGDKLSFAVADSPKYGSVQIDQKTGAFNYKANPFAAGGIDSFTVEVSDGFNVSRVMVQVKIDSTAMNIGFVSGGVVAYTGVVVAALLIIGKLRKKGM